ncbi:MAG: energy-coupling factor ABC transporter permease [Nitrospiraceae bacterium]|nr:energy-coupling factor ABC transporter permease [Nitrospiraceae bacterium]
MSRKEAGRFSILIFFALLLMPANAYAMHISEGILPLGWCVLWFAAAAPFIAYGLRRLKRVSALDVSFKPFAGLLSAMVFIISAMPIPVPTAGTCSHPCGTGITGILLGPGISVLVASVALLLQALFLAHGGLSTLGANIMSMGVTGSIAGYLTFRISRRLGLGLMPAGFVAGVFADWSTYLVTSFELASGIRGHDPLFPLFAKIALAFVPTQLPLGILEGFMTGGMVALLNEKRPDILVKFGVIKQKEAEV